MPFKDSYPNFSAFIGDWLLYRYFYGGEVFEVQYNGFTMNYGSQPAIMFQGTGAGAVTRVGVA